VICAFSIKRVTLATDNGMIIYFTINFAENGELIFLVTFNQKYAKMPLKMETREHHTIFFKLKRNVKVNNESAKRI
jgi:hypothetical protein